jgi:hypothetical protein
VKLPVETAETAIQTSHFDIVPPSKTYADTATETEGRFEPIQEPLHENHQIPEARQQQGPQSYANNIEETIFDLIPKRLRRGRLTSSQEYANDSSSVSISSQNQELMDLKLALDRITGSIGNSHGGGGGTENGKQLREMVNHINDNIDSIAKYNESSIAASEGESLLSQFNTAVDKDQFLRILSLEKRRTNEARKEVNRIIL